MKYDKNSIFCKPVLILGLFVHLLLLCAVCEIYYPSSINQGINLTEPTTDKPDAKRLVLFLADGLRAESIFGTNSQKVPFLNSIMLTAGSWGIARSRHPTFERSGHIAILSGTYENPLSTIYKSWILQPTNIDSLLNQSSNSWCWGGPDAVEVFNLDKLSHIHVIKYPPKNNIILKQPAFYYEWILEEIRKVLKQFNNRKKMRQNTFKEKQIVFLVHLPVRNMADDYFFNINFRTLKEYLTNLDKTIELITMSMEKTFDDGKTSYILASAHGMTDWGFHSGDSPFETETPFIAWGAGIKHNSSQIDLKQVDITPLMAVLIGVPIPKYSIGVIPLNYLNMSEDLLVSDQAINALQLSKIYLDKMRWIKSKSKSLYFYPYKDLDEIKVDDIFIDLQMLYIKRQYGLLLQECENLINELIKGIDYYQSYNQFPLFFCVVVALFQWILFLFLYASGSDPLEKIRPENYSLFFMIICIPLYFCYVHVYPLSYYLYISFPFILFVALYPHFKNLIVKLQLVQLESYINLIIYVLGIELLIFAFFYKIIISYLLLIIGLWINISTDLREFTTKIDKLIWLCLCLTLAFFTSLTRPLSTVFSFPLFIYGICIWIYLFRKLPKNLHEEKQTKYYLNIFFVQKSCFIVGAIFQIILLSGRGYMDYFSSLRYIPWLLSVIPVILIPLSDNLILMRLAAIVLGVVPFYLLMSSSDELLFLVIFVATLFQWLVIEIKAAGEYDDTVIPLDARFGINHNKEDITHHKIRGVFFLLIFFLAGFYCTGNDTNINSFNPSVTMIILVFLKMLTPIFIGGCIFLAINVITKCNTYQMFCCTLLICDIALLQVLFFIRASWFSVTISQFFVINEFIITVFFLHLIIYKVTTFSCLSIAQKLTENELAL